MAQESIQSVKGMNDILPSQIYAWQYVEKKLRCIVESYGYLEIRFPIVEKSCLFERSVGEKTDIVEKEMFLFEDLCLRPEGTAGCVRACIQHGLLYNQIQRLWYSGPLFRRENPQKGRYRQFHQFGVEAFGMAGPDIDAEMILITNRFWKELGLSKGLKLQINSLGTIEERHCFREKLIEYFTDCFDGLDDDSKRRLKTNPLRILDSKNPLMENIISNAPKLFDYLQSDSKEHFNSLCEMLDAAGIVYEINPYLVRGLDYYSHTVFEWITDNPGAQNTVCAGGRFDSLAEQLGSSPVPGIGFALGFERLLELLTELKLIPVETNAIDYYLIVDADRESGGLLLAEKIRNAFPDKKLVVNCGGGSFKSQFKRADKSGALVAIIIGEQEWSTDSVTIKFLREHKPQENVSLDELINKLR